MEELNKSFKPETMRLFVKLDEDCKYHEVEGLSGFGIMEEGGYFSPSETTITINGVNTHVSEDSFTIEREIFKIDNRGCAKLRPNYEYFDELSTAISFKLPSKRDRYKEHLPKRVIVSGPCVISFWNDGTKTISRCHDDDEMDVRTGIMLNAIKKWMPGGTYWQDVMDDVTVEYQGKKEKLEPNFSRPDNLEVIGHGEIVHRPCRPYMRGGRYGDDEKLRVIEDVESGMSQADVSRKYGISQGTISKWVSKWRGND